MVGNGCTYRYRFMAVSCTMMPLVVDVMPALPIDTKSNVCVMGAVCAMTCVGAAVEVGAIVVVGDTVLVGIIVVVGAGVSVTA